MTIPSDKQRLESDATAPVSAISVSDTIVDAQSAEFGEVIAGDYEQLPPVEPGDYVIGSEIARGGMGRILEGRDRRIGRNVALKEILIELLKIYPPAEREMLLRRFEREARITARLEHPAIVPVYEIGQMKGAPFFAMKKVEGRPLDELIAEAPTLAERLRLLPNVIAISDALGYAHTRGVVHRDLKPANVLIGAHGETVVIDWGLAKQIEADDDDTGSELPVIDGNDGLRTVAGSVFGTPLYMPPEQARGEPVDRRADVYSIGSILYHLLAGKSPYVESAKTDRKKILERLRREPPPALTEHSDDIPSDLVSIVEKAMSRSPDERYPSAVELAADLRKFEAGQLVMVHRYSPTALLKRWIKRHQAAVATAMVAVLALLIGGGLLVQELRMARDGAMDFAKLAETRQQEATRLFSELGRAALHRDELVEATFALVQAGLLDSKAPGLEVLMWEISEGMSRVIARVEAGRAIMARFSGDGERLLVGFSDGELRILNAQTGAELLSLQGPPGMQRVRTDDALSFIAAHGPDRTVQLWDVKQRRVLRVISCESKIHKLSGPLVSFSDTGKTMAIGCSFDGVSLQETRTGKEVGKIVVELPQPAGEFSVDGTRLLVTLPGVFVRVYDLVAGKLITDHHHAEAAALRTFSGDFSRAAAVHVDSLSLFDFETDKTVTINTPSRGFETALVSLEGDFAIFSSDDGTLNRYNFETGQLELKWLAHREPIQSVRLSRNGRVIATVGHDRVVRVWDAKTGRRLSSTIGIDMGAFGTLSPDGSRLFVGDHNGGLLVNSGDDEMETIPFGENAWLAHSPSGALRLEGFKRAALYRDGELHEIKNGTITNGSGRHSSSGLFNGDGRLTVGQEGVHDTQTMAIVAPRPVSVASPTSAAISRDGKTVAMSSNGHYVVWDVETSAVQLANSTARQYEVAWALLSAAGETLVLAYRGELLFVDTRTGESKAQPLIESTKAIASENREHILSFGPRRTTLWSVESGEPVTILPGASRAALSADDKYIVIQDVDKHEVLSLFDAQTGARLGSLDNDRASIDSYNVAANAGLVVGAERSGMVRIWDVPSGRLLLQRRLPNGPHSISISPKGDEVAFAVDHRVLILPIGRMSKPPEVLLERLRELYTTRFFDDNFLLVR